MKVKKILAINGPWPDRLKKRHSFARKTHPHKENSKKLTLVVFPVLFTPKNQGCFIFF